MKIKDREKNDFPATFRKITKSIFSEKVRKFLNWTLIILFFIIGILFGLIFAGYFGTFDQPSGKAYTLLTSIGIGDLHQFRIFFQGLANENIKIIPNLIYGQLSKPEKLTIDINFENMQKIEYKRQQAIEKGYLDSSGEDFVPATVTYNDKKYDAEIRLKGDLADHWTGDKVSLRIKVKGDEAIMGMKVFSIQDPATRQELNEFIYQRALQEVGVIGLRYKFVDVIINGEHKGIYALEENFEKELIEYNNRHEGPILKFNEDTSFKDYWERGKISFSLVEEFYGSQIDSFENEESILNDPVKTAQYKKAIELLESLRAGTLKPHEIFDVDKTAKYYAMSTFLNCPHSGTWHNMRVYYNPVTSLLEPVGFDGNCRIIGSGEAFKEYAPACIYFADTNDCIAEPQDFYGLILSDGIIFDEYIKELENISEKNYLDNLLDNFEDETNTNLNILHKEKPFYYFSTESLYSSQTEIKETLDIQKGTNAYLIKNDSKNSLLLNIGNVNYIPIEILGVSCNGSYFKMQNQADRILQPRNISEVPKYKQVYFVFSSGNPVTEECLNTLKVDYKIAGASITKSDAVSRLPYTTEISTDRDVVRESSEIDKINMLEVNENSKSIRFKEGNWVINETITLPEGYFIFVNKNTNLDLINNASIISHSPIVFYGEKENPVRIFSSDRTGQGLVILNAYKTSTLKYVNFENLTSSTKGDWAVTGAITFYNSPFNIEEVTVSGMKSEDSLNAINSKFNIKNSTFKDCFSDCFDDDFGEGVIESSLFENCGNDCMDISGAKVKVENVDIFKSGDKGISGGEKSNVTVNNLRITSQAEEKGFIGIASKDQSQVFISNTNISNYKYGLATYQKKPEFGPAEIYGSYIILNNLNENYLIEKNSNFILDGIVIIGTEKEVYNKLYGA